MSVDEILSTFTDRGEPKFSNITVEQNYSTETTKIYFPDFGVTLSGNDKMLYGTILSEQHERKCPENCLGYNGACNRDVYSLYCNLVF